MGMLGETKYAALKFSYLLSDCIGFVGLCCQLGNRLPRLLRDRAEKWSQYLEDKANSLAKEPTDNDQFVYLITITHWHTGHLS